MCASLQKDRKKWSCWVPSRVDPFCILNVSGRVHYFGGLNVHVVGHGVRIGDWYPERNIFQILIAITAGEHTSSPHCAFSRLTGDRIYRPSLRAGFTSVSPHAYPNVIASAHCIHNWTCTDTLMRRLGVYHIKRRSRYS